MRTLNLVELERKISTDSSDINFPSQECMKDKVTQFFNFLHDQSISKRILERINEDFVSIKEALPCSPKSPDFGIPL